MWKWLQLVEVNIIISGRSHCWHILRTHDAAVFHSGSHELELPVPAESQFSHYRPAWYDRHTAPLGHKPAQTHDPYYKNNPITTQSTFVLPLFPHLFLEMSYFYIGFHFLLPFIWIYLLFWDYSCGRIKVFDSVWGKCSHVLRVIITKPNINIRCDLCLLGFNCRGFSWLWI